MAIAGALSVLGCGASPDGVAAPLAGPQGRPNTDDTSVPRAGELGLLPAGTTLHTARDLNDPAFTVGPGVPITVYIEDVADGVARVNTGVDMRHCGRELRDLSWLQLELFVDATRFSAVVREDLSFEHEDGTRLELEAGVGVRPGDDGIHVWLWNARSREAAAIPAVVPGHALARSYPRDPDREFNNRLEEEPPPEGSLDDPPPVHSLAHATKATLGGATVELPAYTDHDVVASRGDATLIRIGGPCVSATVLADDVESTTLAPSVPSGLYAMKGPKPKEGKHRIISGARAYWPSGAVAGVSVGDRVVKSVSRQDPRLCIQPQSTDDVVEQGGELCFEPDRVDRGAPSPTPHVYVWSHRPRVYVDGMSASEPLGHSRASRAVLHHLPDIWPCYQRALKREPDYEAIIPVSMTVGIDGKVSASKRKLEADFVPKPDPGLDECVFGVTKTWQFPRLAQPATVEFALALMWD